MKKENMEEKMCHPGYYVDRIIETNDLDEEDFAAGTGIPAEELAELRKCSRPMTASYAKGIGDYLGTTEALWMLIQEEYDKAQ